MRVAAKTSLRTLTLGQWWFITFTVLVSLPIVLGFVFLSNIYVWYLEQFVEPGLERDLGFHGGEITIRQGTKSYRWYGVVSVVPGGPFARAGVQSGDLPVGYAHGARSGFITDLHQARGGSVVRPFVNRVSVEAGKWQEKRLTIVVPAKGAG